VRPWVAGVFTSATFIDRVWAEPKPSGLRDWLRITNEIRRSAYDLALLFPNSFESALMIFLGRIPQRIGYATDGRGWLLNVPVRNLEGKHHQVDYYMEIAKVLSGAVERPSIEIEATAAEKEQARKLLTSAGVPDNKPFLVLNPGAAFGSAKRWGEDRFAAVADALAAEYGFNTVIVGSEVERSIAEQIRERMKHPVTVLNGRTSLETLIGVISKSALMVTNDSGPMHIAAALGIPTVAVFGSTDEVVTGPCGPRTWIVKHPVECSPCLLRECPIDNRCITRVTIEEVYRAAREAVASRV
jgi:heptosyltransferase-2